MRVERPAPPSLTSNVAESGSRGWTTTRPAGGWVGWGHIQRESVFTVEAAKLAPTRGIGPRCRLIRVETDALHNRCPRDRMALGVAHIEHDGFPFNQTVGRCLDGLAGLVVAFAGEPCRTSRSTWFQREREFLGIDPVAFVPYTAFAETPLGNIGLGPARCRGVEDLAFMMCIGDDQAGLDFMREPAECERPVGAGRGDERDRRPGQVQLPGFASAEPPRTREDRSRRP